MAFDGYGGGVVRRGRRVTRPSGVFIGMLVLFVASGWLAWSGGRAGAGWVRLGVFVFVVTGWVISLCLHEYAHARFAYSAGDTAVVERGYLTLNPLRYVSPFLSIVLPVLLLLIGGIGLPGGAVWVDRHSNASRVTRSLISAAGPLTNLVCAVVLVSPFLLGVNTLGHLEFWAALAFLCFLQITATLLNLMPIPGVDGGNAIEPWLSPEWRRGFDHVAPWGLLLLFALLFSPQISGVFFRGVDAVGSALGLPAGLVGYGFQLFRFWA